MLEVYQIWDYEAYIEEVEETEKMINSWFEKITEIGQNNSFSDEDIADLEYYLALLEDYDLLKFSEVKK